MEILLLIFISSISQFFFPWWSMTICAFVIGFLMLKTTKSAFSKGFIAIALLWIIVASVQYFSGAEIIATRVSPLVKLPHPAIAIAITGLLGGIIAGFATLSGYQLKQAISSK